MRGRSAEEDEARRTNNTTRYLRRVTGDEPLVEVSDKSSCNQ